MAIVRAPAANLSEALTTMELGEPDHARAVSQHQRYCAALERCGLELIRLDADEAFPDSTFVEDTAVLARHGAILTRPGAESRLGEVDRIVKALTPWFGSLERIRAPGTVDGGDVCEAGGHFFIGISDRTNEAGARQLSDLLADLGHRSSFVDIRGLGGLLHLKSGLASLGDNRLVVTESLASHKEFGTHELVRVGGEEEYAANCIRVNDSVLIAEGYPKFASTLAALGYQTIALEMSEFQKIDGGLSCLSLRF